MRTLRDRDLAARRRWLLAAAAGLGLAAAPTARAQAWPSRPIRIVVGYPAGGLTDLFARAYGEFIGQKLGQPVVVENRTGAGGSLAAQAVKAAAPDGYTLMFTISTTMLMNRVLYKNPGYDADNDFELISMMSAGHLPLVVSKNVPVNNLKEFAEYARRNKVAIGTYAAGSYSHVAVAELNRHFGLQMEAVHYRGEAPMWQDLAAGVIQAASGSIVAAAPVLQSGAGKMLAVPTRQRNKAFPDVPTFWEEGLQLRAFEVEGFICLVGPKGIPEDILDRLSSLMVEGGKSERVQKILTASYIDTAAIGRQEFRKIYDRDGPVWIELVRSLGVTPQ
ncbi:MAG TPA: tripartite tricarboxylate transporter substrate binding protein [Burkholderiaceae bacterium]|nr:tripartite tricarboxylate transporter substrate binding protein [Burkholderiaceae bacterium]